MSADPTYVLDNTNPNPEPTPVEEVPDAAALQAQIDELNRNLEHQAKLREVAETQASYWFDAAGKKLDQQPEPNAPKVQLPPQVAPELNEERYNQILSNPAEMQKYVQEVAEFNARTISRQEASQIADSKATEIQAFQHRLQSAWGAEVNRLRSAGVTGFGVAGDPMTDVFAQKVQGMMQDPNYANLDPVIAMKLAISEAEAEYLRGGGQVQPPQYDEQPQPVPQYPRALTPQQTQAQRNAAIAAQSGSRGRKPAAPEKFANIPAEQMETLQKYAKGFGIPVEKIIEQMPRVVKFR